MEPTRTEDAERLRALIEAGDAAGIEAFIGPLHTADIADLLQPLDIEEQIVCLKRLDTQTAAEVLAELDAKSGQALLTRLSDDEVGKILEELPSDDAADLISSLTPEKTERVEALLPTEDREEIQELLEFGAHTAGGLMQVERVAVRDDATIQDAIDVVRRAAEDVESPQRVYVVNEAGKLLGEMSILDLVIKPPTARVRDVMQLNAVAVPVDMDQKQVAAMFSKYDEFTMPVVDGQWRLVGRITMDDIIDVLEEEASKDLTRIAGTTDQELGEKSFVRVSGIRLPWLVMGFLGEIVGALIMSRYEAPLRTFVVLAFFIPLIVATAGNHGMQAAIVAVREIALGTGRHPSYRPARAQRTAGGIPERCGIGLDAVHLRLSVARRLGTRRVVVDLVDADDSGGVLDRLRGAFVSASMERGSRRRHRSLHHRVQRRRRNGDILDPGDGVSESALGERTCWSKTTESCWRSREAARPAWVWSFWVARAARFD